MYNLRPQNSQKKHKVSSLTSNNLGDDFWGSDTKGKGNKSKSKHVGPHQNKTLSTAKETINKVKRQPEWQEIFANQIFDEGLISKIYKELIQLNNKRKTNKTHNLKMRR